LLFAAKTVTKGTTLDLSTPPLPGGDLNQDGKVNEDDVQILDTKYDPLTAASDCTPPTPASQTGFSCHADINDNGYVNALDFSLLIKNYGNQEVEIPD